MCIVLRLGGFHSLMCFVGTVLERFERSSLGALWKVLDMKRILKQFMEKKLLPMCFRKGHIQGTSLPYWSLPEKCPNTEILLVRIFLYSDWIRRFTELSPYSVRIQKNTDQKKLPIWILFTQWMMQVFRLSSKYLSSICCQKQQVVLMKRLLRRLLIKILQMQNFKQLMLHTYPWPHLFIIIIWRFGSFLKCISMAPNSTHSGNLHPSVTFG